MRLGGLGLRSASRMRHSAYWASWADSLQMISQRLTVVATQVLAHLAMDQRATGCSGELQEATDKLDHEGFVSRQEWTALRDGALPKRTLPNLANGSTAGNTPLPNTISGRAWSLPSRLSGIRLISGRILGPAASAVLLGCPTSCEHQLQPETFRVLTLERSQSMSLKARCLCVLLGRHRGACPRSERLKSRVVPTERTLVRVCCEAGAVVRSNVKLRDRPS